MNTKWRTELEGLPTEEYIKTCVRITAIDYEHYLRFVSTNDSFTKQQAHRDWRATIDRLLQSQHPGLIQKGKGLKQLWDSNAHMHTDNMHWALQRRKQAAKLQSVAITSLADATVNKMMKRRLQEELGRPYVLQYMVLVAVLPSSLLILSIDVLRRLG